MLVLSSVILVNKHPTAAALLAQTTLFAGCLVVFSKKCRKKFEKFARSIGLES